MRSTPILFLAALLAACGGGEAEPVDITMTPEGRLCGRAYGSTLDSIEDTLKQQGIAMPGKMPTKEEYVEKCVSMGFTDEQAKCLDPKLASLDPEHCQEVLEPVKDKKAELDRLFSDAFDQTAEDEEGAEAEVEAAEGEEGAEAEGEATEGEAAE